MNKKTLGQVLRKQREALALTQRQVAKQLGVRASHVAYLERGLRKPSLSLLRRIADRLGLDGQKLFFLSHPEARLLLERCLAPQRPKPFDDAWRRFIGSRALLDRHNVTRAELKILRQVSLLRRVSSPRQFLFVLNSIRQASEDEWPVPG
jgi:transcriptional regulator with XRE-family HTH domain